MIADRQRYKRGAKSEFVSIPPLWATAVALIVGGAAGFWFWENLEAPAHVIWFVGLLFVSGMSLFAIWMDPGHPDNMARDRDPKATGARNWRLTLIFCAIQWPMVMWSLLGDQYPEGWTRPTSSETLSRLAAVEGAAPQLSAVQWSRSDEDYPRNLPPSV